MGLKLNKQTLIIGLSALLSLGQSAYLANTINKLNQAELRLDEYTAQIKSLNSALDDAGRQYVELNYKAGQYISNMQASFAQILVDESAKCPALNKYLQVQR